MSGLFPDPMDLLQPETHTSGDSFRIWEWMRKHSPVYQHREDEFPSFWSVTRHSGVKSVYRNPQTFSSAYGVLLRKSACGVDPGGGSTLALTDPPRHKYLRSIVAPWFSERSARSFEGSLQREVAEIVGRAIDLKEFDFVKEIAARVSNSAICLLLGIPADSFDDVLHWTNDSYAEQRSLATSQGLIRYLAESVHERTAEPRNDLLTSLVGASTGEGRLTEREIILNCENLIGATENGRLALAGGIDAFLDNTSEWELLGKDIGLLPSATEEILRWTSSATHSLRYVTRPTRIHGQDVVAGQWVVVWLPSANRDSEVFDAPDVFRISRAPNHHLSFGFAEHFCLGAVMARLQIRLVLRELLVRTRSMDRTGASVQTSSIAVGGPASLPLRLVPK